jgi:hypothetical protein
VQQTNTYGAGDNGSISERIRNVQQINRIEGDLRLAYADVGDNYYFGKVQHSTVDKPHTTRQPRISPLHGHVVDPNITFDSMATRDGRRKTAVNEGTDHEVPVSRLPHPNVRVRSFVKVKMKKVANEILPCFNFRVIKEE